jgi:hypothetical protein
MRRLNEKVHWSVIERLNRDGIVDERRTHKYEPKNLPPDLPEDLEADGARNDRVTYKTQREADLIELCRKGNQNQRIKGCALFCSLNDIAAEAPPTLAMLGWLGALLSAGGRRVARLQRLRRIWDMPGS